MRSEVTELRTYTVEQAADATGIQKWRIYEMVKRGEGPAHFRVGRTIRFRTTDIAAWLEAQTNNHTKER